VGLRRRDLSPFEIPFYAINEIYNIKLSNFISNNMPYYFSFYDVTTKDIGCQNEKPRNVQVTIRMNSDVEEDVQSDLSYAQHI
jgi:hypothetical protein